jgi:transposase-like protein
MTSYLKGNDVTVQNGNDVNSIMRDMMSIILEDVLDQEMEEKIISMYAKGMTTSDIESHMNYGCHTLQRKTGKPDY